VSHSSFRLACVRYARLRRAAYEHVAAEASAAGLLCTHFKDIDDDVLREWRCSWPPRGDRYGGWDWEAIARPLLRRPSALPLALYADDRLVGLAAGRCSRRRASGTRRTLSIAYIEADPDRAHPLRGQVGLLVTTAASTYGAALGVGRLRLLDPLPGVWPLYRKLGFSLAREGGRSVYFERAV
jgi:hypothetical protein